MVRSVLSLFSRRRAADPQALPDAILEALDCAFVLIRPETGDTARQDHVVVQIPGGAGFRFTAANAACAIAKTWPELDEVQVSDAAKRLSRLVAVRQAAHARAAALDGTANARPYLTRF
ncbi:hypothetical protein [Sphingomonas sanguinis]|jgi:hypothetical protein|uniref:Uncharacterized protein n=1 Tax=Sphingomonas sanguinis TaxID=33051 RepID=A0A7Y7QU11_9SPHN|nr:hypothetical protein [Sphingomonas sanguinis]MBZ6381124.1 hypothetical protein [Sphingomonas sanguinis]NNG51272.1 hypothetical protein [Sphingomonas sanguinis]NNG55222.1 hypothetical protein [Sphingomonas sanguinis]NVP30426.1 hypothetical protein [Sphingomonas sanguinis]